MNREAVNSMLVEAALDMLPPDIQQTILKDEAFLNKWNIPTTTSITFDEQGISFRRDVFYNGVRTAISDLGNSVTLLDERNAGWTLLVQEKDDQLTFSMSSDEKQFSLTDYSGIAENMATRINWFEKVANEVNLNIESYEHWIENIRSAPLSDEDFKDLIFDIENTPISMYRRLQSDIDHRKCIERTTLVPRVARYYDCLVGRFGSISTTEEYIETVAMPMIADLQRWNKVQGFLYALLTCTTDKISECIKIDEMSRDEIAQAYRWLKEHGDPISLIGAVEIAFVNLDSHPELSDFVEQCVERFISDTATNEHDDFTLLSSMIILVGSELARTRTLGEVVPFCRKQAAITQASLIVRANNEFRGNPASLLKWVEYSGFNHRFYLQGLVDLRCEPRWLPEFVRARQLRAEIIGRIRNSATKNESKIYTESMRALVIGPNSKIAGAVDSLSSYFPGPLEGELTSRVVISYEEMRNINEALKAEQLTAHSFAGLINAALVFDLPVGQSKLVADALRRINYSLGNTDNEEILLELVNGLAFLAAVTRGTDLAETLRVLYRVLRRRKRLTADFDKEFRVLMVAAASFENLEDWAQFAGEWITEIAFESIEKVAAGMFLQTIRGLVRIEPALARHCASADAALASLVG